MTEGTQEPALAAETPPAAAVPAPARRRGPIRRFFNWFWRGWELKQLRLQGKATSPRARQLALRGRLLLELGERARHPAEPLPYPGDAPAAELFRQSAYWSVRAVAALRDDAPATEDPWAALDSALAQKLAGASERVAELIERVERSTFLDAWELPEEQRALRAAEMAGVAKLLQEELAWRNRAVDALWLQRVVRIGLVLLLVALVIGAVRWISDRSEQSRDLAVGKPWRASSSMSGVGCTSPLQECGESTDYFFHTNNESGPWLELDLGGPARFSGVRVQNRKDCCFDRAVPLIVEISNDQKQYKEVARRTTSFSSWLATFAPTEARYVRLRVPRHSLLHLSRVRVLR